MGDGLEEIASVTYHRLVEMMANDEAIKTALKNEAWELVSVLIRALNEDSNISQENARKYANGIMEFSKTMYLMKIVDFPNENETGKYRNCDDLVKYWVEGKSILSNI